MNDGSVLIEENNDNIIIEIKDEDNIIVSVEESNNIIDIEISEAIQGDQGIQGIQGIQGPPAEFLYKTTGEDIGGNRVVIINEDGLVYYAYNTLISHLSRTIGITTHAAAKGEIIEIQIFGEMVFNGWAWETFKNIYLSVNGLLTQDVPALPDSYYLQILGFPTSLTSMIIRVREPIILA
jgi:hypothetical protein